jgi:hypothetical protein
VAEELAGSFNAAATPSGPTAVSAQALWQFFDIKNAPTLAPPPPAAMLDSTRQAYTSLHLAKKDASGALEVANKPGKADDRIRALAVGAEWSDQPAPFVEAADKVLTEFAKVDSAAPISAYPLLRLAIAAAQLGEGEKAARFVKAIRDPETALRAYAEAEVLRYTLARDVGKMAAETDAFLPATLDAKTFLAGHAWGRLHLARHNGFLKDASLAKQYLDNWPKPLVAPFGAAGAMLGVQDKAVAP